MSVAYSRGAKFKVIGQASFPNSGLALIYGVRTNASWLKRSGHIEISVGCQACSAWKTQVLPGLVMWRQFGDFQTASFTEKCYLVISGEIGNAGKFPNFNHFNQNQSIIKIFVNLTSIPVAIKNRFHIQQNIIFTMFGLVLCKFIVPIPAIFMSRKVPTQTRNITGKR